MAKPAETKPTSDIHPLPLSRRDKIISRPTPWGSASESAKRRSSKPARMVEMIISKPCKKTITEMIRPTALSKPSPAISK